MSGAVDARDFWRKFSSVMSRPEGPFHAGLQISFVWSMQVAYTITNIVTEDLVARDALPAEALGWGGTLTQASSSETLTFFPASGAHLGVFSDKVKLALSWMKGFLDETTVRSAGAKGRCRAH